MISCRRLGYAVLSVADLEREIAHYQEVVGLFLSSKERDRAVFVGPTGEECLVLVREDDPPQLKGLSFEVLPSTDLAEINARLKRSGIASEVSQGSTPLIDKVVRFPDPLGRTIELFTHRGFFSDPVEVRGIAPIKLGDVASFVTDLGSITEFYSLSWAFVGRIGSKGALCFCAARPIIIQSIFSAAIPPGLDTSHSKLRTMPNWVGPRIFGPKQILLGLGTCTAPHRSQHCVLPQQSWWRADRVLCRNGFNEGRRFGLLRSSTLARRPAATAQGVASRNRSQQMDSRCSVSTCSINEPS